MLKKSFFSDIFEKKINITKNCVLSLCKILFELFIVVYNLYTSMQSYCATTDSGYDNSEQHLLRKH